MTFFKPKIAVVGDIILDRYIYGEVNRINPEAPVPILDMVKKVDCLGGASNVANNIVSMGVDAYLFGYVGKDKYGQIIKKNLKKLGIEGKLYHSNKTTLKTRFGNPQILRVDDEEKVTKHFNKDIIHQIQQLNPNLVVISDYGKGCINQNLFNKLKNYKLIVDPKPRNNVDYSECYLIVPNEKEARDLNGKYQNTLITRGANGMSLGKKHFPTEAKEVFDVSGAGDTVVASLAIKLSQGNTLIEAIKFANKMAGNVVSKRGTSVPEKIVFTNGCFDVFHVGHSYLLKEAKKLGYLVVGLNSDDSIRRIKREPINYERDRLGMLESLGFIDEIILFNEDTPINLVKKINPDIYIRGGDFTLETIDPVREYMKGKIKIVPIKNNISSSKIIKKINRNTPKS